jgi:GNAT superfamily N-acetyltransferase
MTTLDTSQMCSHLQKKLFDADGLYHGLYLEDLFIIPEKRGRGYGKALLKYLARTAVERNCGRMEWICLDWNQPALNVYRSIGAVPMDEWTVQRLSETALKQFADSEIN